MVNIPSTDIDLLRRVAKHDSKALEVLYNRYSPLLYTLIKKMVTEQSLAQEILADVFVIVWRKSNKFNFNSENVYAWIVTLARNKAADEIRRKRFAGNAPEYTEGFEDNYILPHLSPKTDSLDLKTALNIKGSVETALNKLTDAQQYVIYLAYYEGLTEEEIAAKLNIPLQTVKSKVKIALSNLKENLIKGDA